MKKIFSIFLIAATVLVIGGCSKSTDSTNDNVDLEAVSEFVGEGNLTMDLGLVDMTYAMLDEHFGLIAGKRAAKANYDNIEFLQVITHDSSNYWHIFTCSAVVVGDFNDTAHYSGIDSIRLTHASGYTYVPDSTLTGIDMHWHFSAQFANAFQAGDINSHAGINLGINGYDTPEITINGTTIDSLDLYLTDDTNYCNMGLYFSQSLTDILIDSTVQNSGDCPASGQIDMAFALQFECQNNLQTEYQSYNGEFTADVLFDNGNASFTFRNGNNTYTNSSVCGGGSPMNTPPGKLRR